MLRVPGAAGPVHDANEYHPEISDYKARCPAGSWVAS